MKINEIQQVNEIPAGGLGQAAKKVGSRVLNKLPSARAKSKAANIAAKADLGDTANILHKEFNAYLGSRDKNMNQATGEDLADFIKSEKRHQTKASIPQGTLTGKQIDDILMTVAKEATAKRTGATSDEAPSSGDDEQTAGGSGEQGDDIKFSPNQSVKFKGRDGKVRDAVVVDKATKPENVRIQSGETQIEVPRAELINPNTGKPFQPGDKPQDVKQTEIPPDIAKQLRGLTDEQKQQLVRLL